MNKPITGYIKEAIRKIHSDTPVSRVPEILVDYFSKQSSVPNTYFIVAGYEKDSEEVHQKLYRVYLNNARLIIPIDTFAQGAIWDGETSTLTRLVQNVALINKDGTYSAQPRNEILWNYFTLQDAVDFARYAVETTINTMRFTKVIKTVGGNIDILVITPDETKWIQKTEIM